MSHIIFPFDERKGNAMLEYILSQIGGKYSYIGLAKLAFFADRYHIRTYARPVSMDTYYAMKNGAVPSNLLNVMLINANESQNFKIEHKYEVKLLSNREDTTDLFSETDIEAMRFAIDKFASIGSRDRFKLADLTHAYPEWSRYRERFAANPKGREDMFYEDFVLNADPDHEEFRKNKMSDPFPPLSANEQQDVLAEMQEYCAQLA